MADEYWIAYEESSEVIDTVPLYYGALSLGNAISYATLSSARFRNRTTGHGLSVTYNVANRHAVLNARISFGGPNDSFGIINEALGGEALNGLTIPLIELLRAIPELSDRLEHISVECSAFEFTFSPARRQSSSLDVDVDLVAVIRQADVSSISTGYVRDRFAIGKYLEANQLAIEGPDSFRWKPVRSVLEELKNVAVTAQGGWWFLPKIGGRIVPEYSVYVAVLHALSVFARYVPDYWLKLNESHGDEWVLIRDFITVAEEKVPTLALDHFVRTTHEFVSVS